MHAGRKKHVAGYDRNDAAKHKSISLRASQPNIGTVSSAQRRRSGSGTCFSVRKRSKRLFTVSISLRYSPPWVRTIGFFLIHSRRQWIQVASLRFIGKNDSWMWLNGRLASYILEGGTERKPRWRGTFRHSIVTDRGTVSLAASTTTISVWTN